MIGLIWVLPDRSLLLTAPSISERTIDVLLSTFFQSREFVRLWTDHIRPEVQSTFIQRFKYVPIKPNLYEQG